MLYNQPTARLIMHAGTPRVILSPGRNELKIEDMSH